MLNLQAIENMCSQNASMNVEELLPYFYGFKGRHANNIILLKWTLNFVLMTVTFDVSIYSGKIVKGF